MKDIKDKLLIGLLSALISGVSVHVANAITLAGRAAEVEARLNGKLEQLMEEQTRRYDLIWEELRYLRTKLDNQP